MRLFFLAVCAAAGCRRCWSLTRALIFASCSARERAGAAMGGLVFWRLSGDEVSGLPVLPAAEVPVGVAVGVASALTQTVALVKLSASAREAG